MKVGFIGLGIMGKPMSKNLLKKGHEVVVFDFNKAAVEEVVACGGVAAESSAEVAAHCRDSKARHNSHRYELNRPS